jgi:hypothetical protein
MDTVQHWGETLRLLVEISATAAFALSGVMAAARKRLDALGVCAFAGGWVYVGVAHQRTRFSGFGQLPGGDSRPAGTRHLEKLGTAHLAHLRRTDTAALFF